MSTALRTYYRGASLVGVREQPTSQTRQYHFDHQGTTQCLTGSNGAVTDRFAADAWGAEVKRTGSSINRHWYVGKSGYYRQPEHRLDYVRRRYLGVLRGRWTSVDPVPSQPRYVYVLNTPASAVDPSGTQCKPIHGEGSSMPYQGCFLGCAATPLRIVKSEIVNRRGVRNGQLAIAAVFAVSIEATVICKWSGSVPTCPKNPFRLCQAFKSFASYAGLGVVQNVTKWCPDTEITVEATQSARDLGVVFTCEDVLRFRNLPWEYWGPTSYPGPFRSLVPVISDPFKDPGIGRVQTWCAYPLRLFDGPGIASRVTRIASFDPLWGRVEPGQWDLTWTPGLVDTELKTWICCEGASGPLGNSQFTGADSHLHKELQWGVQVFGAGGPGQLVIGG